MTATMTATRISLETACDHPSCSEFAFPLYNQLRRGYEECAVLPLPRHVDEWRAEHRTARKRADRAFRRGYTFEGIRRHQRAGEIHLINLSAQVRQGREMSPGYRLRPTETPLPDYPCRRHAIRAYGVEDDHGVLVAYSYIYRAGGLALVSQILGHANHLEREVMFLLVEGIVDAEARIGDGYLVYNRYDSGTDGLRFFKDRCGFKPTQVEWTP